MAVFVHTDQSAKISSSRQVDWRALFQLLLASGFLALCSQIKVVLPFTPIPLTFQTLAVLLIGATLGSRKGFYALVFYCAEVAMGLPVLSGGSSDPLVFFGPKGGYVLGFCLQAYLMGWCVEKMPGSKSLVLLFGGILSCALQMMMGVAGLAHFVGWNAVWTLGFYPFIPGEIAKILIVSFGLTFMKK